VIVSLTISPIRDADDQVVSAEIARDVTDREHAEQALREAKSVLRRWPTQRP
jgi:hypothetical protein